MSLGMPDPMVLPGHRLRPVDFLIQRRWKWAPAVLASDPAHRHHAGLVLS
jgi:hypothetical protein